MHTHVNTRLFSALSLVAIFVVSLLLAGLGYAFYSLMVLLEPERVVSAGQLSLFATLEVAIVVIVMGLVWTLWQTIKSLHETHLENTALISLNAMIDDKVAHAEHINTLLMSEQSKLESVFSSVSDMIVVIDQHGIIQSVNHSAMTLFGYWQDELLGKNINILMPKDVAVHHDGYLQRYWASTLREGLALPARRVTAQDKDGSLIEIELEVRCIHLGDDMLFVGVLRDIRAQLELVQKLKDARDEAIRTAELKSQFLANMSHELRTPLNGMISMSQLLEEDLKTPVLKDRAKVISSSAKHLLSIVNDILDFSRIHSGKFELYPKSFDVESWLMDSLAIHLQVAKDKQLGLSLTIEQGVPKHLMADTLRLSQILHNLLSNALKFTTEGGVFVTVALSSVVKKDNQSVAELTLSVRDTGMGMSENALKLLFQPFSQVDNSASRVHGGTGLGLMISCELSQLMQGGIQVRSALGEGSTFEVSVWLTMVDDLRLTQTHLDVCALDKFAQDEPTAHHTLDENESELYQPEQFHPARLLVVEDNPINQKVVSALLKRFGYEFDTAYHGEEALVALEKRPYDLILMDCQMPILDGYETSRKLRHREAETGEHIPIIALTAHAMEGEDQKCFAAGMDDYLSKPLDHALLKTKIERWLLKKA